QFAFHGDAAGVRHFHGEAGDIDVVVVAGGRFSVFAQRAVHHHRGEAELDGTLADIGADAVVLVHHYRDVRELFHGGEDEVAQERRAGILAGAGAGLHDHRRVAGVGGFHDG